MYIVHLGYSTEKYQGGSMIVYSKSIVQELYQDCKRTQIVTDAMELLNDGYPLDEDMKDLLAGIGVNYIEFTREFEIAV